MPRWPARTRDRIVQLRMRRRTSCAWPWLVLLGAVLSAPAGAQPEEPEFDGLPVEIRPWTGDLDGMLERRIIRVLTP